MECTNDQILTQELKGHKTKRLKAYTTILWHKHLVCILRVIWTNTLYKAENLSYLSKNETWKITCKDEKHKTTPNCTHIWNQTSNKPKKQQRKELKPQEHEFLECKLYIEQKETTKHQNKTREIKPFRWIEKEIKPWKHQETQKQPIKSEDNSRTSDEHQEQWKTSSTIDTKRLKWKINGGKQF